MKIGDSITNNLKRKMKVALIPAIFLIATTLMVLGLDLNLVGSYSTSNSPVGATATALGICYVSVSPVSLTFAATSAGGTDPTNLQLTDTDNGGNQAANIFVAGNTAWTTVSAGAFNSFLIGNTLWNPTTQGTYVGNALTNALVDSKIQIPAPNQMTTSTSNSIWFGLQIPGGTYATGGGTVYTTTIIIEDQC